MRRVVVTGMGAVSPFGIGVDALWRGLLEGRNGIRRLPSPPFGGEVVRIAGALPDVKRAAVPGRSRPPEDPSAALFMAAVEEAIAASGLDLAGMADTDQVGTFIADRAFGHVAYLDSYGPALAQSRSPSGDLDPALFLAAIERIDPLPRRQAHDPDSVNHLCARAYGITGPMLAVSTACASGSSAIGEAAVRVQSGGLDAVIAGGAYAFDLHAMIGFSRLGALTSNPDPGTACRPFDARRSGFVMGSGCGVLVLEEFGAARRRGAEILAEVRGYGAYSDAFRATDPDPEATGIARTISACLASARVPAEAVDYINAHGTSTRMNDQIETVGIKKVFGERAYRVSVSSTKSMIGHAIMAAGALEAIVCVQSIREGVVHPTRNWQERDPDCDLDYVPGAAREQRVRHALSNSFGFGGQNASLLFSALDA